jgi:predicted enzyme related to lactoylglutathione lyase
VSDAPAEVGWVIFDCVDEDRVATFWQELLGLEGRRRRDQYVFARAPSGLGFGFQRVAGAKTSKNRVHVDLRVADLPRTRTHVVELGGAELPDYDGGFVVMADPEGNEFCLIPAEDAA